MASAVALLLLRLSVKDNAENSERKEATFEPTAGPFDSNDGGHTGSIGSAEINPVSRPNAMKPQVNAANNIMPPERRAGGEQFSCDEEDVEAGMCCVFLERAQRKFGWPRPTRPVARAVAVGLPSVSIKALKWL